MALILSPLVGLCGDAHAWPWAQPSSLGSNSPVQATTLNEIRSVVESLEDLPAFCNGALTEHTWVNFPVVEGQAIQAAHINELRTAIRNIFTGRCYTPIAGNTVFTADVTASTPVLLTHILDMRTALNYVESVACVSSCLPPSDCPNGVVNNPPETCDDGNANSGDGCASNCQCECTPWVDDAACNTGVCAGTGQRQQTRICNVPIAQCPQTRCVACAVSCNNGVQDGTETGVDCGGTCPACPTCSGTNCAGTFVTVNVGAIECAPNSVSYQCIAANTWQPVGACVCNPVTCSGTRCGGAFVTVGLNVEECAPNGTRWRCVAQDTWSHVGTCTCGGGCTCSDGVQNCGENCVDGGGPCGAGCPPTCSDNQQNQGETGVDCGGPCGPCGNPPVNGGWTSWSACDQPPCAGGGMQYRTCTNPAPAYGGTNCAGSPSQACNTEDCGPTCGDGACNGGENCGSCAADCGTGCTQPGGICQGVCGVQTYTNGTDSCGQPCSGSYNCGPGDVCGGGCCDLICCAGGTSRAGSCVGNDWECNV